MALGTKFPQLPPKQPTTLGGARQVVTPVTSLPVGDSDVQRPENDFDPDAATHSTVDRGSGPTPAAAVRHAADDGLKVESLQLELHPAMRNTPLASLMVGNKIDVAQLTPALVASLEPEALHVLMLTLAGANVRIRGFEGVVHDSRGRVAKFFNRPLDANAAAVVSLRVLASGDRDAFIRAFAACPDAIAPFVTYDHGKLLTSENLADLMAVLQKAPRLIGGQDLKALGQLMSLYLESQVGRDLTQAPEVIQQLIGALQESGVSTTPQNVGIIVGAALAGLGRLAHRPTEEAEKKKVRIGAAVNIQWATVGGLLGPWGAAAAALVVVTHSLVTGPKSPHPEAAETVAARLQGAIQAEWLQQTPENWSDQDLQKAMSWINTTLLSNGLVMR